MIIQDLSRELLLSLHELIFSYDIVVYELFDLNIAVVVGVTLAE